MKYPIYRANVQNMCSNAQVPNPIEEDCLTIAALSFLVDGEWIKVEGTDKNRAGRLYFQHNLGHRVNDVPANVRELRPTGKPTTTTNRLKTHFAELWDLPADEVGLIVRYSKVASHVTLHWK